MSVMAATTSRKNQANGQIPHEPIWRFTVDQYHKMIQKAILTEDDPVELLEGWLVIRMPKNPVHRAKTKLVAKLLERLVENGWSVDRQDPITTEDSEPEPDVSVVRVDTTRLVDRHPSPREVGLVVEVSDSTLQRDRTIKKQIYAAARIPVYWIVNLVDKQIEVYTTPTGRGKKPNYRKRQDFKPGDSIPVILDGKKVGFLAVSDILL